MGIIQYLEISPIELLGYAKNNIVEVEDRVLKLPQEYTDKLSQAYRLLDEVQEYLYSTEVNTIDDVDY